MTDPYIPSGWKLVPIEITHEMDMAAKDYARRFAKWADAFGGGPPDHDGIYNAMIMAAPPPPEVP